MTSTRQDIFERVAARIIASLEEAQADIAAGKRWAFPWVKGANASGFAFPTSIAGKQYRGANAWLLLTAGYPSMLFGTYKAWQAKGAQVRQGEHGLPVLFWKPMTIKVKDEATGLPVTRRILFARGFTVFAAEQVDGFDLEAYRARREAKLPNAAERIALAEAAVEAYQATTKLSAISWGNQHGHGFEACYVPALDQVHMPRREAFTSTAGLYSTLFHELGHSTGHDARLKRDLGKRFGSETYAAEELVAELCAAMCCGTLGIETETRESHGRYIASWLRSLKNDPKCVVTAASHAQRAADMILGTERDEEAKSEPQNGEELKADGEGKEA